MIWSQQFNYLNLKFQNLGSRSSWYYKEVFVSTNSVLFPFVLVFSLEILWAEPIKPTSYKFYERLASLKVLVRIPYHWRQAYLIHKYQAQGFGFFLSYLVFILLSRNIHHKSKSRFTQCAWYVALGMLTQTSKWKEGKLGEPLVVRKYYAYRLWKLIYLIESAKMNQKRQPKLTNTTAQMPNRSWW